tara:strand:+ start:1070 stop:1492 length:423 start_codon:yes stop_codon:yes gene_type:complete
MFLIIKKRIVERSFVMRLLVLAFLMSLSTGAFGEISDNRLRVLLNICDAAQKSADLGTVRNIASQIQNTELPENEQLAAAFENCLSTAFGETKKKPNVNQLIEEVENTYSKLEADCRALLRVGPEIAIVHPICKAVLTKP